MMASQFPSPAGGAFGNWDPLHQALSTVGASSQPPSAADWYLDTGATTHMASSPGNFPPAHLTPHSSSITVGNGAQLPVTHHTFSSIPTSSSPLYLRNVLVAPSLIKNLLSVRRLTRDNNVSIEFDPTGFSIKDLPTRTERLRCDSRGDLYPLWLPVHHALAASSSSAVSLWHQRLGHPGQHVLSQILDRFDFNCNKSEAHSCSSCRLGKHVRLPFSASETYTYFPFQLLHSDVWTSPVLSHSGYRYYLAILDDYTHYLWTFPMRNKSEVLPILRSFLAYVQTQFRLPVLALQTDNGKEFDSTASRTLFAAHGIQFRLSCPYTSQQNGEAERVLRTLNDCVRTMLLHSAAPLAFWAEALSTATYLLNQRPCRATGSATPFGLLFGAEPSYDELRVFGCRCFPNLTATTKHKLDPRSMICVFIGYPADHRGYRCYDLATNQVITSRHVVSDEQVFPFRATPAAPSENRSDVVLDDPPPPRRPEHDTPDPPTTTTPSLASALPRHPVRQRTGRLVPNPPATSSPWSTPTHSAMTSPRTPGTSPVPDVVAGTPSAPSATTTPSAPSATTTQRSTSTSAPAAPAHSMVTRAKAGVFKPNPKYALQVQSAAPSPHSIICQGGTT